jgi:hypothetical protein
MKIQVAVLMCVVAIVTLMIIIGSDNPPNDSTAQLSGTVQRGDWTDQQIMRIYYPDYNPITGVYQGSHH